MLLEQQVLREFKALQELQDRQVQSVQQVLKEFKVQQDLKARLVPKELLESRVSQEPLVLKVLREIKVRLAFRE